MKQAAGRVIYNPAVRKIKSNSMLLNTLGLQILFSAVLLSAAWAQEPDSGTAEAKTKVQVNFLNSCNPAPADLDTMRWALGHVQDRPSFSSDFEISRGRTTLTEAEARATGTPVGSGSSPSNWVRISRDFPEKAVLTNAQYSLSVDGESTSEVLALHLRDVKADGKDILQVLISDSVKGSPSQVVKVDTPPDRIRIERFGKASIVLARCASDQSAYEPLFQTAAGILEKYRSAMAVKTVVPSELAHLPRPKESKAAGPNHK